VKSGWKDERGLGVDGSLTSLNMEKGKKFLGSMFSHEEKTVSLIGEGISVVGSLNFESGVVRVDGRLQGKIIGGGTLIIGEGGIVQGEVHVGRLILCGRVEGTVDTSQFTHIAPTGKLFGKVQTPQLVIDEGGIFDGESKFVPKEETAATSPQL